jgi:hypothetical protein
MDFLFVSGMPPVAFPANAVEALGAWPKFTIQPRSDGFLAFTDSTYEGLSPLAPDSAPATLVIGDPLFDWTSYAATASGRTRQIADRLTQESLDSETFRPFGGSAVVRIFPASARRGVPLCEVRSDRTGGGSVFVAVRAGLLAVSSSPDLIALAIGAALDLVSCAELVSQSRITAPNTLYEGIRELGPRQLHRFRRVGIRRQIEETTVAVSRDNTAASVSLDLARAKTAFARYLDAFFDRLDANVSPQTPITSTLSAGMDSRALTVAAFRRFGNRVSAFTGAPWENLELATGKQVAAQLGIRHTAVIWDIATYRSRFESGLGLAVGSHRRWTDAHFLGVALDLGHSAVLGGFFSDAFVEGNGGPTVARRAAIEKGLLAADSDWYAVSQHLSILPTATRKAIGQRAEDSVAALEPRFAVRADLRFSIPTGRALASAQWRALQRQWAQYEPFPTEQIALLSLSAGSLRRKGFKRELFADVLDDSGVEDLPTNPDPPGTGGGAWIIFRRQFDSDPDFAASIQSMAAEAIAATGLPRRAVRDRSLLVNVYWANRICTQWAPRQT